MTIIAGATIDWTISPRIVTVPVAETSATVEDMQDTLLDLEYTETGIVFPFTRSTSGGENLGGGVTVGLTTELQDVQIAFARTAPIQTGTVTTTTAESNNRIQLIDTSATFQTNGVKRGDWIINFTDQSVTEIISVDSETQVTCNGLSDGTLDVFTLNDAYKVWEVKEAQLEGGNFVAVDSIDVALNPVFPTFGRFVSKASASSSTTANQEQLEYATFNGGVSLDTTTPYTGDVYPVGNQEFPVNNLTDALQIANNRGFSKIYIVSPTFTFATTDVVDDFIFEGDSATRHLLTLTEDATITNCIFRNLAINGFLDGGCSASFCIIFNLNYIDGSLLDCLFSTGTITLSGTQANFLRCASAVAGGGGGQTPTIDLNGGGTDLVIRDYQGGIELTNMSVATDNVSIDMSSGRVVLDSTITDCNLTIRGIGELQDNKTGGTVDSTGLLDPNIVNTQLQEMMKRWDLDSSDANTYADDGSSIANTTFTLTATDNGNGTFTVNRS